VTLMPEVTVVVVTYNSMHVIDAALGPLAADPRIEIIVVDNDSADQTVSHVNKQYPSVSVMQMSDNLGFAKAVNLGVAAANAPTVMLLNPDARITKSDLKTLRDALATPGVGLVGPLIVEPTGQQRIVPAGRFPTAWRMICHYYGLSRLFANIPLFEGHYLLPNQLSTAPKVVDWLTGACMLFERATWVDAGGLSERWFMYAEDIDFCLRVKKLGLNVALETNAVAGHLVGQSDSTASFSMNPAWIVNLQDLHATAFSRHAIERWVWKVGVGSGLYLRGLVATALAQGGAAGKRPKFRNDAQRFKVYSNAVLSRGSGSVAQRSIA
jgi:N-acetylglucosaminyl-diphospho-decaprenol L-rhamnosyltransferase